MLKRAGHTEAVVDLCQAAGLYPAGLLCEIMDEDGEMARMPELEALCAEHGLKMCSVRQIIEYRLMGEHLVERLEPRAAGPSALPPDEAAHIARLAGPIRRGTADYVKGNRFFDLESIKEMPLLRKIGNAGMSLLNKIASGAIIIAGSGMCNGGRIRHHLKHNLWRNQSHVVFVGFQAQGTPGRALVDGVKNFKLGGEEIAVRATIHTLGGFSAHASQSQLLQWLDHFKSNKPRLFLVHGEQRAKLALQEAAGKHGWSAEIPELNQTIEF